MTSPPEPEPISRPAASVFERVMFRKVELWVVGLLAVAALLGTIALTAIVRTTAAGDDRFGAVGELALDVSKAPEEAVRVLRLLIQGDQPDLEVSENRFEGQRGWGFGYPEGGDVQAGYLLLSRYDGDRARSIVELVDLNAQRAVFQWHPDFSAINAQSSLDSRFIDVGRDNAPNRARIIHPILTPAGELVFQNTSPMAKIGACGDVIWTLDRLVHHSNELHPDGGYITLTLIEPSTLPGVGRLFREDGIAHISEQGRILSEKSIPGLLIENGFGHLVYGLGTYQDDPLHANDVQPVPYDGPHFRKGDLFLSLRNVAAIVLYRPSTNKVLWVKQGPWVNQHDVNVLDDHRISVFSNNRYDHAKTSHVNGFSDVMIYDFATGATTSPYAQSLRDLDVRTPFEGRAEVQPDGDVIVEETEGGRTLRLRQDGTVEWRHVNRGSDGRLYLVSWSRYIPREEGAAIAGRLASLDCSETNGTER